MNSGQHETYEQGSQLCIQYSALTMRVRTLSHQVMLAQVAAILASLMGGKDGPSPYLSSVFLVGGLTVALASVVLGLLNQHHSAAFRPVRDYALVPLESAVISRGVGPWTAHKLERDSRPVWSTLAWHLPFIVMGTLGLGSMSAWHYMNWSSHDFSWFVISALVGMIVTLTFAVRAGWHNRHRRAAARLAVSRLLERGR